MEADWSVALAAGDPVITVPWAASDDDVDPSADSSICACSLHGIDEIEEARAKPRLRSALLLLNGAASQFWTAKCDAWSSSVDEGDEAFDPYEMDAEPRRDGIRRRLVHRLAAARGRAALQLRMSGAMDARGD